MKTLHFTGTVKKLGDYINTDAILPAKYLNLTTPEQLGPHCLESYDPSFVASVTPGDIVVAGRNFGCGSSREHAPQALIGCGVACVIAHSFSRIFFRNAINLGLPLLGLEAADEIAAGSMLDVDCAQGVVRNLSNSKEYRVPLLPPFMRDMLLAGGLIPSLKKKH